jgi:hypothetical protein
MYRTHLTLKSENAKTGPIPVSTTGAQTCPTVCPFRKDAEGGCYAAGGPLAMHWAKVTEGSRGGDWSTLCAQVASMPDGQVWRHNQAGDLPGDGVNIDADALAALVASNTGRRGFTYTHYDPAQGVNAESIAHANRSGFTVNLSGNNLAHADQLAALNIGPVVVVLPADAKGNTQTPSGRKVVVCPATQRDDVSCATCQLCQRQRDAIVGFPAHGSTKKRAEGAMRRFVPIVAA